MALESYQQKYKSFRGNDFRYFKGWTVLFEPLYLFLAGSHLVCLCIAIASMTKQQSFLSPFSVHSVSTLERIRQEIQVHSWYFEHTFQSMRDGGGKPITSFIELIVLCRLRNFWVLTEYDALVEHGWSLLNAVCFCYHDLVLYNYWWNLNGVNVLIRYDALVDHGWSLFLVWYNYCLNLNGFGGDTLCNGAVKSAATVLRLWC